MSANQSTRTPSLREALYALSMAKRIPNAEVLDEIVRQYPHFAEELTEFAVELVVDSLRKPEIDEAESEIDPQFVNADVSRSISIFHNRVYLLRREAENRREERRDRFGSARNPFASLTRSDFRKVAKLMGATAALVTKLRDGQIRPDTMTDGFRSHVADVLGKVSDVPPEVVHGHLATGGGGAGAIRQFYKARSTPRTQKPQSLEEAVRSSGLSQEQQLRLLSL